MSFAQKIGALEREIAAVRSHHRDAQRALEVGKAQAEQRAIVAAGGVKALGSNEDERRRALTLALADDAAYQELIERHADIQHRLERFEADLRGVEAQRRESEWATRQQLIGALMGQRIPSDQLDRGGDGAFDDVALERAIKTVEAVGRADLLAHQQIAMHQARQGLIALRNSLSAYANLPNYDDPWPSDLTPPPVEQDIPF